MNRDTEPLIVDLDYYRNNTRNYIYPPVITLGGCIFMTLLTLFIMFLFVFFSVIRR